MCKIEKLFWSFYFRLPLIILPLSRIYQTLPHHRPPASVGSQSTWDPTASLLADCELNDAREHYVSFPVSLSSAWLPKLGIEHTPCALERVPSPVIPCKLPFSRPFSLCLRSFACEVRAFLLGGRLGAISICWNPFESLLWMQILLPLFPLFLSMGFDCFVEVVHF